MRCALTLASSFVRTICTSSSSWTRKRSVNFNWTSPFTRRAAVLGMPKLKLKPQNVLIASDNILHVLPTDDALKERRALFMLQHMRLAVPAVIVQGIPSVGRAVISDKGDGRTTSSSKASTYKPSWVSRGSRAPKRERTTSWSASARSASKLRERASSRRSAIRWGAHGMSIDNRHRCYLPTS